MEEVNLLILLTFVCDTDGDTLAEEDWEFDNDVCAVVDCWKFTVFGGGDGFDGWYIRDIIINFIIIYYSSNLK